MIQKRKTTSDAIYETLKMKIVELEYEPDQQLIEESLATELEISRTPLRQALYRLESEGLVVKKATGRVFVSSVSIKEAEEIFLVRELMEGLVTRQATVNIHNHENKEVIIHKLEDITFLMRNSAETKRQVDMVSYGNEFHQVLQTFSNNKTALDILTQLNTRLSRYRRLGSYKDPNFPSTLPVQEHEEILRYIKQQDALTAEKAMRSHIKRSLESAIKALSHLSLEAL